MVDTVNPLGLSDDDFAKLPLPGDESPAAAEPTIEAPAAEAAGAEGASAEEQQGQQGAAAGEEGKEGQGTEGAEGTGAEAQGTEGEGEGGAKPAAGAEGAEGGAAQPKAEEQQDKEGAEAPKPEGAVPPAGSEPKAGDVATPFKMPTPEEATAFFMKVMTPIKANGKTIELRTPEEAIQLMQQGANYTQKMQAIAPHRKMLTMLQNNSLLDEDKLSFLIDLEKGNPEAIQKLLKDKNVDVLALDTESEPTYLGGNHKVSDNEVAFQTNLSELSSTSEGKETLQTINSTWDDASKEVLWGEPGLMPVIHAQRANGIYDRIVTEMDRRRTLGQIAPETSFITAYRTVGDDLMKSGGFDDLAPKVEPKPAAPAPVAVATTAAAPKAVVENGDKASAASPTRSTPKPAKAIVNPLAMSDEEFEAQFASMQGRV